MKFLFSLFCLQASYVINTSTSILTGWSFNLISLNSKLFLKSAFIKKCVIIHLSNKHIYQFGK
ncbi:hypothetical protein DN397_12915 [Bacillus sp. AY1-10]|nr:hypothetical protein DN397_12915 [Bacillus sp. AY1-10]TBX87897.1 hypothetical protein E0M29_20375 [Bacillus cereus]